MNNVKEKMSVKIQNVDIYDHHSINGVPNESTLRKNNLT